VVFLLPRNQRLKKEEEEKEEEGIEGNKTLSCY